ncbi:PglL family O-oligosaccharyltransferase [Thaumasiovibrio subtropicus]|uniref:PglL family O-oligosaccharyltransferase n=1 Tax=Thaumasiovibrio subtropicus TaxID=1891207 RepID=UPI001FE56F8A|nr:PglL family O-oligosaccharyltransferase [Thaumasiovibrio subtropicus]
METTQVARKPLTRWFLGSLGAIYLIAMHLFMHNPGGAGLSLPFNQAIWIPLSFAIGAGLLEICRQGFWRYSKLTIVLLISCILLTLPIFYPQSVPHLAVPRLIGIWAGWLLFVSLQQFSFTQKQRQRLLWFVLIAVLMEAIFGWIQYLLLEPGNYIGYNTFKNKPYGIFQQINVMASFMATGLVLSAYLLAREPMYRGKWNWKHLPLLVTPILTIPLIAVIDSRTGKLGATVSALLILPFLYHYAARKQMRLWGLMVLLGLALSWNWTQSPEFTPKLDAPGRIEERAGIYPHTLYMIKQAPVIGSGYGNFESAYTQSAAFQFAQEISAHTPSAALDHPHNELLYWTAEGGIVPLIALLIAAGAVFIRVLKTKKGTRLAIIGLFFPITLHSQLEYPFYHALVHFITFILLIYWVDQLTAKYKKKPLYRVQLLRINALLIPALATVFIASGLQSGYWLNKFEQKIPREPELLMKVTNPVLWQSRFDWNLFTTELEFGVATNNPDMIQSYIHWAHKTAETMPRPSLYQNMAIAYHALGEVEKGQQILDEARYLFPNHPLTEPTVTITSSSSTPAVSETN